MVTPGPRKAKGRKLCDSILDLRPVDLAGAPRLEGSCAGLALDERGAQRSHMAMGHNLCLHFGADEHPCTAYFDVRQGFPGF